MTRRSTAYSIRTGGNTRPWQHTPPASRAGDRQHVHGRLVPMETRKWWRFW